MKRFEYAGWANDSDQRISRIDRETIEAAFANEAELRGLKPWS